LVDLRRPSGHQLIDGQLLTVQCSDELLERDLHFGRHLAQILGLRGHDDESDPNCEHDRDDQPRQHVN
jgi:hypothetical protein